MSLYLHVADKHALLDTVVEEVFAELHHRMVAAAAGTEDPVDALCAQGSAYVRFALEHPGAYRYAVLEGPGRATARTRSSNCPARRPTDSSLPP